MQRPRIYLHVGEPKTGTTFLQQVMWRNRGELAAQGLVLPGHHAMDHYWAQQDLRGVQKLESDPISPWDGEWDILAAQAVTAGDLAVISHELLAAAEPEQAARAMASFPGREVHIVLTVRDPASLLPAEWQESVKHRTVTTWLDWLRDVIDDEYDEPDRRRYWFWRVHDTLALLDMWGRDLPPERIHVITVPRRGAPPDELWRRFAGMLGIDPAAADVTRAGRNSSLGIPEMEFLRRLNERLTDKVPDWYYMRQIKEPVAHQALAARPRGPALRLPDERYLWAQQYAEKVVTGIQERGYDVIGDFDELVPRPPTGPELLPEDADPAAMLEAALDTAAAIVWRQFRRTYVDKPPVKPTGFVARLEAAVGRSPRVKQTVRNLSAKYPAARRVRVAAWRVLERAREAEERRRPRRVR